MTRFEKIQKMVKKELARYLVEHIDCKMCRSEIIMLEWLEEEFDDQEYARYVIDDEDYIKRIDYAIKCIELQIPMMPTQHEWSPALCPNCGAELSIYKGDGYYKHLTNLKICNCGQKLKWEVDDEE